MGEEGESDGGIKRKKQNCERRDKGRDGSGCEQEEQVNEGSRHTSYPSPGS